MTGLTIVIPSHNRADLLELCLRSVGRFKPEHATVLVVDDASPGGAVGAVAGRYPGVRVVRTARRVGFARAANLGVELADTPIVQLLNDDTEVTPGWADAVLPRFDDATVAGVAPLVLEYDPARVARGLPPRVDSAGDDYHPGGFARKRFHGQEYMHAPRSAHVVAGVSAAAAFYRRSAVLEAGGFPADFGAYFEDVDLSCRLRRGGGVIWYEPRSVVWHRVSASYGRAVTGKLLAMQSCNEERLFWRNRPDDRRSRDLGLHAAVLAGKAARRLTEGAIGPWLAGRARGLAIEFGRQPADPAAGRAAGHAGTTRSGGTRCRPGDFS